MNGCKIFNENLLIIRTEENMMHNKNFYFLQKINELLFIVNYIVNNSQFYIEDKQTSKYYNKKEIK